MMGFQVLGLLLASAGLVAAQVGPVEYRERRERLMAQFPDGVVLLHARPTAAELDQHRFRQEPTFYYFTGLQNQPSAILALDGRARRSVLFVPPAPTGFGGTLSGVGLVPGPDSARSAGLDEVQSWDELKPYLASRLGAGGRHLVVDDPRRPVPPGNPPSFAPMAGEHALWRHALSLSFPSVEIRSAAQAIRTMRFVKSPAEVAILRRVARASADAALAGMRAIDVGVDQRSSEAAVVSGCIAAGAQGPSFWPWTMSGPNAHAPVLSRSFYDYEHLNRVMKGGELVRVDVGCDLEHYEGDVGRTVPVSGRFTKEQAEAWNLLIAAYRAGLNAIRDGATRAELAAASRAGVASAEPETDYGRRAVALIRDSEDSMWHVHGVGIDAGEERVDPLRTGAVIAYEPGFSLDDDAYYLEDMILVTGDAFEILTTGLPYEASDVEAAMSIETKH